MLDVRHFVFSLYERQRVRNWFYTLAFAIFVPVGFRFALLAWKFGTPADRFLTIVGGMTVGITALVTLLRIWIVPPRRTVVHDSDLHPHLSVHLHTATEIADAARLCSARNRQMAREARALGSSRVLFH